MPGQEFAGPAIDLEDQILAVFDIIIERCPGDPQACGDIPQGAVGDPIGIELPRGLVDQTVAAAGLGNCRNRFGTGLGRVMMALR